MSAGRERIFGLDVLRAAAILLVVFWHSYDAITYLAPGFSTPFFLDGVDLFFALSGYLIGGILLGVVRKPGLSWWQRLSGFWQRRFFRTLPNYYLFLLVNIVLLAMGIGKGLLNHNALAYFAFLQNVWKPFDLFFWESWSLVVEVWFYVLFPLTLFFLIGAMKLSVRWSFTLAVILFMVFPVLVRHAMAADIATIFQQELTVRKLVITRIDTIVFGVAAALAQVAFPGPWHRLRWPLFALGITGMVLAPSFYGPEHLRYSINWYYSLNALSMALLLPLMAAWRTVPVGGVVITWVSMTSYALFLVHLPVRSLLEPYYDPALPIGGWLQLAIYWTLCLVLAWLVYRWYEKPMMDLRDRFGPRRSKAVTPSS